MIWERCWYNKRKITQVGIATLLKNEIEYYIKKNGKYSNFDEFLIRLLKHGLQSEILGSMSRLEKSYRCKDLNHKIVRRVYTSFKAIKKSTFYAKNTHWIQFLTSTSQKKRFNGEIGNLLAKLYFSENTADYVKL